MKQAGMSSAKRAPPACCCCSPKAQSAPAIGPILPSPPLPCARPDFFLDLWLIEGRAVVLSRLLVALGFPVSRLLDCPCTRQHN